MIKRLLYMFLVANLAFGSQVYAADVTGWDELEPELKLDRLRLVKLQAGLSLQNKRDLVYLRDAMRLRAAGQGSEELTDRERQAIASLAASNVDAEPILREMVEIDRLKRENGNRLVESLDGRRISLAGYMLPTEYSGDKVVEFMLVADDGACIHTPVPPMNQLVHVRFEEAFESQGLFTPVVVSGVINTNASKQTINYSDGVLDVAVGYSMQASEVVLYE